MAEPGRCEADISETKFSVEGFNCEACWGELSIRCWCGSLGRCVQFLACGAVGGQRAELDEGLADVAEGVFVETAGCDDGAVGEDAGEVTVDMVREELARMAHNVDRMVSFDEVLGQLHGQLDEISESMVTRGAYERLVTQLGQLEAGVGRAEDRAERFDEDAGYTDDEQDEHSEYTEGEGGEEYYGYFDGDGNSIPSEDEHAAFEN